MNKTLRVLLALAAASVICLGLATGSYGQEVRITEQQAFSPNTTQNRRDIAQTVLEDTGRTGEFMPQEATNIILDYGELVGDGNEQMIVVAEFGPKDSIAAVYTPVSGGYEYLGQLGRFEFIRNFNFLALESLGREIAILREYADEDIGAFEQSTHFKGYLWVDNAFRQVLNIPEQIQATWNTMLEGSPETESIWKRIEERTEATYSNGENSRIDLVKYQTYRQAEGSSKEEVPQVFEFNTINSRIVNQTYTWSDEWLYFILGEATDNNTGQRVAVLEDFGAAPYGLLEEYNAEYGSNVRILKQDGTEEVVPRDRLTGEGQENALFYTTYNE